MEGIPSGNFFLSLIRPGGRASGLDGHEGGAAFRELQWEAAVPALIEALKDPESQVRYHALSALGNLMYNAEPPDLVAIVPAVTELLKDEVAARSGREPSGRVYIPDPGTKWDEALDLVSSGCRRGASLHSSL